MRKKGLIWLVILLCLPANLAVYADNSTPGENAETRERLAIYYSYPSIVNGANGDVGLATSEFAAYDLIVFADTIEHQEHADHEKTKQIISNLNALNKKVFGYVDLGCTASKLSISTVQQYMDEWKDMGVYGIFLDCAGFDYGVTRERQNDAVDYAHDKGLYVFMNAWNPDDVSGDLDESGLSNPSLVGTGDWYLAESWMVSSNKYLVHERIPDGHGGTSEFDWLVKAQKSLEYQNTKGIRTAAVATNVGGAAQPDDNLDDKFKAAWWSAAMFGFPFQWTDGFYSSTSSSLIHYSDPLVNYGTLAGSGPEVQIPDGLTGVPGHLFRTTDKGVIHVDLKWDTSGRTLGGVGYFTPILLDGEANEWSEIPVLAKQTGKLTTLKAYNDLKRLYVLVQGNGLKGSDQFYFDSDNNAGTGYSSWMVTGADYLLENSKLYRYVGSGSDDIWDVAGGITTPAAALVRTSSTIELSIPLEHLGANAGNTIGIGYILGGSAKKRFPASGSTLPSYASLPFPSSNADLHELSISPGMIDYDANHHNYTFTIPYTEAAVDISALAADEAATLTINGETVSRGADYNAVLRDGNNDLQIVITAENGIDTNEYNLRFYRETELEGTAVYPSITADGNLSDWQKIKASTIGAGFLRKLAFTNDKNNLFLLLEGNQLNTNSAVGFFYLDTDNNPDTGFQAAGWSASGAEYFLQDNLLFRYSGTGTNWSWDYVSTITPDHYHKTDSSVELVVPLSNLAINKGDTISVGFMAYSAGYVENERLPASGQSLPSKKLVSETSSNNSALQSLSIDTGALIFAPETLTYTIIAPTTVVQASVAAATYDSNAALYINGELAISGTPTTISLQSGDTTIPVMVVAENEVSSITYSITVTRPSPSIQ